MNDIERNIIEILSMILNNKSVIHMDDNIVELGINSFLFIKLVVELESIYNFEFKQLDYKKYITIRDISKYVEESIG